MVASKRAPSTCRDADILQDPFLRIPYWSSKLGRSNKIWAILTLLLVLASYVYSNFFGNHEARDSIVVVVVTLINSGLLTVSNVVTAVGFLRADKSEWLLRSFVDVTKKINPEDLTKGRKYWIGFTLVHFAYVAQTSLDVFAVGSLVEPSSYPFFVNRNVQFYVYWIVMFHVNAFGFNVGRKFRTLNERLDAVFDEFAERNKFRVVEEYKTKAVRREVIRTRKIHLELCDFLDVFNEVFGTTLLIATIYVTSIVLWSLTIILGHGILGDGFDRRPFTAYKTATFFGWMFIAMALMLAKSGYNVQKRNADIVRTCFVFLGRLPPSLSHAQRNDITEDVQLLIQQTSRTDIGISAGGFFIINYGVLGFVITNVTTYLIVCIQFILTGRYGSAQNTTDV